jgi:hypothetical protein
MDSGEVGRLMFWMSQTKKDVRDLFTYYWFRDGGVGESS